MSALATLQYRMALAIRTNEVQVDDLVSETAAVSRAVRLGVYQNAYIARLDEALRSNYPKLHALLGDDDMFTLTTAYQEAHPSPRPSIRWFGDLLPQFLAQHEPYASAPILAEVAAFEWAMCCAFDAEDVPTLPISVLTELHDEQWPSLQVQFQPAFTTLALQWNAPAVWHALNDDEAPPRPSEAEQAWAIWRHELQPRFRSLAKDEVALIDTIRSGKRFEEACEVLLQWHSEDEAPGCAAAYLGQWIAEGWISRLHPN
jgi:hypothetical protein